MLVGLDVGDIMAYHDAYQLFEGGLAGIPAEEFLGLRGVTQEGFHFGRTEVLRVDLDEDATCGDIDTTLFDAFTLPA